MAIEIMNSRRLRILSSVLAVIAVLGVGAVGASSVYRGRANPGDEAEDGGKGQVPPDGAGASATQSRVPVRVYELGTTSEACDQRSLTGVVRPRYQTEMAFRVSGKIRSRHIEVGQTVRAGQLLFELEDEDFRLQQKAAEANLQIARANLIQTTADERRQQQLRSSNAISAAEYERSVAARDAAIGQELSAQRQLEIAGNQLAYCKLVAGTDGIVTEVSAEAGQVVALGARVCVIAQECEWEAVVDIPENRLPDVKELKAEATFWSMPGVKAKAVLRELSPIADPLTRTYQGRFSILDAPPTVKLGMTATVAWNCDIEVDDADAARFSIPATAVFQRDGKPAVWVVEPDEGEIRAECVEIVKYEKERLVVRASLAHGQWIVSAGAYQLDESQRVSVWEKQR